MRHKVVSLLASTALLLSLGCSSQAADSTVAPMSDPAQLSMGMELFAANCAKCHGPDLRGTATGPSLFSQVYEPGHHADGAFLVAVRNGSPQHHWNFGPMPPIEGLTNDDVGAIIAFVRERQEDQGFEPYPP